MRREFGEERLRLDYFRNRRKLGEKEGAKTPRTVETYIQNKIFALEITKTPITQRYNEKRIA